MKTLIFILVFVLFGLGARAGTVAGYLGYMLPSVSVTIANGQQESSLIKLNGMALVGITTPAALTGTALTFESCNSAGASCIPVKVTTSGTALSYTVTTSSYYAIDPKDFQGIQYLKIKSGSAEGALRTLVCSLKGL